MSAKKTTGNGPELKGEGTVRLKTLRDFSRANASTFAFHMFMGTCAVAVALTFVELLIFAPEGSTESPRFRPFLSNACIIGLIYLGNFLIQRLNFNEVDVAAARVWMLLGFVSVSMLIGTYSLGWATHAATAAIFSSILICLMHSAKLAHLSLVWYAVLALVGFSLNPSREPLTSLMAYPLSASWSLFTALIIPFSIAATMTHVIEQVLQEYELRQLKLLKTSETLRRQAYTDPLTGFLSRNRLEREFAAKQKIIAMNKGQGLLVALLDLDNFKAVNTSAGHAAGDAVLKESAEIIRSRLPEASLIRLGGDEFIAFQEITGKEDDYLKVLSDIAQSAPTHYQKEDIWHSLSIGYTVIYHQNATIGQAIAEADLAMRQAKREGKGRAVRYAPGGSVPAASSLPINEVGFNPSLAGSDVKQEIPSRSVGAAILSGEIDFELQPILDMTRGSIVGAEALLRWRLPDGSLVPLEHYLSTFVALEWQSPFIGFLSKKRLAIIQEIRAVAPIDVHFNFVLESIQEHGQSEEVAKLLTNVKNRNVGLVVELSEKRFDNILAPLQLGEHTEMQSSPLRAAAAQAGVKLALDDFGTGQSNLDRLVCQPVQLVKLDRRVCLKVVESKRARAVIRYTRKICEELHIGLIAEGIETQVQSDALAELGVTLHQGFFHFEPMTKPDFLELLRQRAA